jgi:hypothetical protein
MIEAGTRARMKAILDDIRSDPFSREWMLENKVAVRAGSGQVPGTVYLIPGSGDSILNSRFRGQYT